MLLVGLKNIIKRFVPLETYCKKCGTTAEVFTVSDKYWDWVVDDTEHEYCVHCFDRTAKNKGFYNEWVVKKVSVADGMTGTDFD